MTNDVDRLSARLHDAFDRDLTTEKSRWLWTALLELLAAGEPVSVEQLAAATGRDVDEVARMLPAMASIEFDEQGRVVGSGISLRPTPYRFTLDGVALHTWCALDTLIFPVILGRTAWVESVCPASGEPVRLRVDPDGVSDLNPATTVVSVVTPDDVTDVRSAFCNQVHFFASSAAAAQWLSAHPGTVIPVADAFTLGRRLAQTMTDRAAETGCC